MIITSRQNPKVKAALQLRKRKTRDELRLMLIEGYEEFTMAVKSGAAIQQVFYCPELMLEPIQVALLDKVSAAEHIEVSRDIFEKLAYRESPDGWLAVASELASSLGGIRLPVDKAALVIVCESVEKPGNIGAILRTADAVGADAVIAADPTTDWSNPNIIRASKGAVFSVPVASATTDELLAWLRDNKIAILAATPDTDKQYTDVDLQKAVAIAVGTEKYGLTDRWFAAAEYKIRIPMKGKIDSLNVATSAAIIAYEVIRQRG